MAFGFNKKRDGKIGSVSVKDVVGALFNAPNTAVGLTYGSLGQAVGEIAFQAGLQAKAPRVVRGPERTEFTNNPLANPGAITIGATTSYFDDPYDPVDRARHWARREAKEGHSVQEHEWQHTIQGRQLGPLYLPSNVAGGLTALILDRDELGRPDWHGPHNWNERGPQGAPARPWAPRVDR
jgi:hypothetical protein